MKKIVIKVIGKVDDDYIQDFIKTSLDFKLIKANLNGKFKSNNFSVKVK